MKSQWVKHPLDASEFASQSPGSYSVLCVHSECGKLVTLREESALLTTLLPFQHKSIAAREREKN